MDSVKLEDIKNLVKTTTNRLLMAKEEQKHLKSQIDGMFASDPEWKKLNGEYVRQRKAKKYRELELLGENQGMADHKLELREDIKALQLCLSDYLGTYLRESGKNGFELNGQEISVISKYSFKTKQMRLF